MSKSIAIISAFDTKGEQAEFLCQIIRDRGHLVLTIDIGVLSDSQLPTDISSQEVALAGGSNLSTLRRQANKADSMEAMTRGAQVLVGKLYKEGRFSAIVGLGGGAGSAIISAAMRGLPIGVPKVLVSTVVVGDVGPYVGSADITLMYSVVDIAGMNQILAKVLANAAGAAIGMAETVWRTTGQRPIIVASMFGNTTQCVERARSILDAAGFEVIVFHATGTGGKTMEGLINAGAVAGVLDLTTTEWADELCGGVLSAGTGRLDAAALRGVPQVVAPGCLDMVNFWAADTVPERFRNRQLYRWNSNVTLMRTDLAENRALGKILAGKINQSKGPASVLLPLKGVSQLDSIDGEFWSPEADAALFYELRHNLQPHVTVIEVNANINDALFAQTAAAELLRILQGECKHAVSLV